jgi:hypothetical protein
MRFKNCAPVYFSNLVVTGCAECGFSRISPTGKAQLFTAHPVAGRKGDEGQFTRSIRSRIGCKLN